MRTFSSVHSNAIAADKNKLIAVAAITALHMRHDKRVSHNRLAMNAAISLPTNYKATIWKINVQLSLIHIFALFRLRVKFHQGLDTYMK